MSDSTWHDVANSPRWRVVVAFIRNWVGPFDADVGLAPADLEAILRAKRLQLPAAVREWHILAARWNQGGLNVWVHPERLAAHDDAVEVLSDTEGISSWRVRVADFGIDDPPIISSYYEADEIVFPSFSQFVAAMIMNDVLYGDKTEPVELEPAAARAALTCLVSSRTGAFYTDAPLETASVIAFLYPDFGPAGGKARTTAGRELLQRLEARVKRSWKPPG